jgi:hypothetical protein
MKCKNDLTAEYARECLDYAPETGLFTWKKRPVEHFKKIRGWRLFNSRYAGKNAGCHERGYLSIEINSYAYGAHRLAWLITYGKWPENHIDHIDGIRNNNKINNLRDVPNHENSKNRSMNCKNTTGHSGITIRPNGKWNASISVKGVRTHLGNFKNKEDAIKARNDAEIKYNYHPNHAKQKHRKDIQIRNAQ